MVQQLSPGLQVAEYDLTTIVPAVSTTTGGIAGVFKWGPVDYPTLVPNENFLRSYFYTPSDLNAETWFCAANFLADANALFVNRVISATGQNAVAHVSNVADYSVFLVKNLDDFNNKLEADDFLVDNAGKFIAKYPGDLGNSLYVSVCPSANAFEQVIQTGVTNATISTGSKTLTVHCADATNATLVWQSLTNGDRIHLGNSSINRQVINIKSKGSSPSTNTFTVTLATKYTLSANWSINQIHRSWEFRPYFSKAPGTSPFVTQFGNASAVDQMHIVVADGGGKITGIQNQIIEKYEALSRATDMVRNPNIGNFGYFLPLINQVSHWIWACNPSAGGVANTATNLVNSSTDTPISMQMDGGNDGDDESAIDIGVRQMGYDVYRDRERYDISLLITGKSDEGSDGLDMINYLVENIVGGEDTNVSAIAGRRDAIVLASPPKSTVINNKGNEAVDIQTWAQGLTASSYLVLDSGYGWQYDKYNNKYRWVPLNGGTAGIIARTDLTRDAWWSPAGFNRGQYKNVVKLAYNPTSLAERDIIFQAYVNPVVTFPGQGTILFGDRTFYNQPSAFDAINVRRLFILLEKAISKAAQFLLFEFNDEFTRAQFVAMVTPFLRQIQGLRGITDFFVQCDENNNTPEVIDSNKFVGDIYIKPARAIRYIQLNFIATKDGVDFNTIIGQFGGL